MTGLLYEKKKNKNALTRFLHSGRYEVAKSLIDRRISEKELSFLDIGCGPGTFFNTLPKHRVKNFTGVDIRPDFIEVARERYPDERVQFLLQDVTNPDFQFNGYDIITAFETLEHIPERRVVRLLERLSESDASLFLFSVPAEIGPSVAIKNFGSMLMGYNRKSGNVRETINASLWRLSAVPPHTVYHLGFNWIWLEQTIRHSFGNPEVRSLPYRIVPKFLAPTILFIIDRTQNRVAVT